MIIKKFVAPTMAEALGKVKKELGDQAVILKTRMNRRGNLPGDSPEKCVEVTAAVEQNAKSRLEVTPVGQADTNQAETSQQKPGRSDPKLPSELLERILQEIAEIKSSIGDWKGRPATFFGNLPAELLDFGRFLVARNFPEDFVLELISGISTADNIMNLKRPQLLQMLKERLKSLLPAPEGVNLYPTGATVVMFVGPTGSGKTSALAKLAMNHKVQHGSRLAIVSADNFRADSGHQIKSYCRILSCPCAVVYSGDELSMAIKSQQEGLILIDTPGVNPRDRNDVGELLSLVRAARPHEIHLVLAANTPATDIFGMFESFADFNLDKLLITKLDETFSAGGVITASIKSGKRLSFVSRSREIPGQFLPASSELLVETVLDETREPESRPTWQTEVVGLWQ